MPSKKFLGLILGAAIGTGAGVIAPTFADSLQSGSSPTLQPTSEEMNASGPADAAVNSAGPPMIRCDDRFSCVSIEPSAKAMASDSHVYVRIVHGGLTAARLATGALIFQAGELSCVGSTTLTCTPASEQPPSVPADTSAIATYVHQDVTINPDGTVIVADHETPTIAAVAK